MQCWCLRTVSYRGSKFVVTSPISVWYTNLMSKVSSSCVSEGRGETEAAEKATGALLYRPSTLPQKPAAAARPGAMETLHSAPTGQRKGEAPVFSRQTHLSRLRPLTQHLEEPVEVLGDPGLTFHFLNPI